MPKFKESILVSEIQKPVPPAAVGEKVAMGSGKVIFIFIL